MLSKKKIILAITVKILFSVSGLQAQTVPDSAKQNAAHFFPVYNSSMFVRSTLQKSIPANFYTKQLPFFCAKELQVQKVVGFPVKFRLSSVEYCNWLEGKSR